VPRLAWGWPRASKAFASFGSSAQWAIAADLDTVAREATQNSLDAIRATGGKFGDGELSFTVIRLVGAGKRDFLEALQWDGVASHLEAMANAAGRANAAGQLADNLAGDRASDELLLLRIDDYGASGLGGPEFPDDETSPSDYGNFIKLIRTDLFSDKAQASGGSYGLGKAVYWRYSRYQTALFASQEVGGPQSLQRFIGVCQGFSHELGGARYEGRGYFGLPDDPVASAGMDRAALRGLHLERADGRPGTSALIVGFYDPENPDAGVDQLVDDLRRGIEKNFWPLLARRRTPIRLYKRDHGETLPVPLQVDTRYAELADALRAYDDGRCDEELRMPGDVLVRPIPISVPARKTAPTHGPFTHEARLVVTLSDTSDEARDELENTVCLFRGPEMVVETISKEFPGHVYHAFLLVGRALTVGEPNEDQTLADEFFRNAEPPSHDQWIPRQGMRGAPKVNLGNNYKTPYVNVLRGIQHQVVEELRSVFVAPPPPSPDGPASIVQHLQFLSRGPSSPGAPRKPVTDLLEGHVDAHGSWVVEVQADMANRPGGWSFRPELNFAGDDGTGTAVPALLEPVDACSIAEGRVVVPERGRSRRLTATFRMRSVVEAHPIPADEASVGVDVRDLGHAATEADA
jgi:hypothetical protein